MLSISYKLIREYRGKNGGVGCGQVRVGGRKNLFRLLEHFVYSILFAIVFYGTFFLPVRYFRREIICYRRPPFLSPSLSNCRIALLFSRLCDALNFYSHSCCVGTLDEFLFNVQLSLSHSLSHPHSPSLPVLSMNQECRGEWRSRRVPLVFSSFGWYLHVSNERRVYLIPCSRSLVFRSIKCN